MSLKYWSRKTISLLAALAVLSFGREFAGAPIVQAQEGSPYIEEVRIFDPDFTLPHAFGLAYVPAANALLMIADDRFAVPCEHPDNLTAISVFEDWLGSARIPQVASPINAVFDSRWNRLLMFDNEEQEVIAIGAAPDGSVIPGAISRIEARQYGVQDPQGMTIDPATGALFILSAFDSRIVRVTPDAQGGLDGAIARAEGRISAVDLSQLGLGALRGLAFNPNDAHLYFISSAQLVLYEVTEAGELVAARDFAAAEVAFRDPQGLVFAPSADLTDDPAVVHLYLMDSGLGPLSTNPYPPPGETPGEQGPARIIEFNLTSPVAAQP